MDIVKEIQKEITEEMEFSHNHFSLNIVLDSINNVKNHLIALKQGHKTSRRFVKHIAKFDELKNDNLLKKHDDKMKTLTKLIDKVKSIDEYQFLRNGKYYLGW